MAEKEQGQKSESLTITRIFNAPRERVWRAWTEPEMLKKWWGPKGYTAPVAEIDLRVGGKYHACMRSPDGKDIWSIGTVKEIVRPERLVITDSFSDPEGKAGSGVSLGADFMRGFISMEFSGAFALVKTERASFQKLSIVAGCLVVVVLSWLIYPQLVRELTSHTPTTWLAWTARCYIPSLIGKTKHLAFGGDIDIARLGPKRIKRDPKWALFETIHKNGSFGFLSLPC